MKKIILVITLLCGLNASVFADPYQGGGLFQRGSMSEMGSCRQGLNQDGFPLLPEQHNMNGNQDADAPLGGGVTILLGLCAAYALSRKREG